MGTEDTGLWAYVDVHSTSGKRAQSRRPVQISAHVPTPAPWPSDAYSSSLPHVLQCRSESLAS